MKKFLSLFLAVLLLFSLCSCGEKGDTDKNLKEITFVLDWTPNTNHTGLFVAKKLGYYEEMGLDVNFVQPPEDGAPLVVASGMAQYGINAQDTIAPSYASENPLEVTNVAAIIQHNTSGIISRKGEGMHTPKGLENKTYSTWDSPVEKAMISYSMEKFGGDFGKVKLIPNVITNEPLALKNKDTDAIWVFYGWGGIQAEIEDVPCDFFYFKDIDPAMDYYTPTIIANNDYLKNNAEEAKAFLSATKKGYEYAIENPEESARILIESDETGSLLGAEELVIESQKYLSANYVSEGESWGYIDEERWNGFYSWLYSEGLIAKDITGIGFSNDYLVS